MSAYFVVLSNLASLPCIIYYQYHRKYFYSLQILFTSLFSFLHHMNDSGLDVFMDHGVFDFLDGLYSYLSIYLFSIYLFLSNHYELRTELFLIQTVLQALVFLQIGAIIVLPSTAFMTLMISGFHFRHIRSISLWNPYLYLGVALATADVTCFFMAVQYEYNILHAIHHLIAFNLPIVIDKCVSYPNGNGTNDPPSIQLESPAIRPTNNLVS